MHTFQLRYSSEYYSNALYDTYSSFEAALRAKGTLYTQLMLAGYPKVANSLDIR